ncbi:MAG: pre-peptidase C-terminal domain-containing protein, partial [Terrimicrobiaceae bacterium]
IAIFFAAFSGIASAQTTIGNGQLVSRLSGSKGSERTYMITVPSGQTKLEVKTYGGSGDADLYVKRSAVPTTSSYDYRSNGGSNTETITVNSPSSGVWYIKVRAFSTYSGLTVVATYTAPIAAVATPRINPGSMSTTSPVTVTLSCSTSGATIRYTTNGSDPTSSSTIYGGAFTLSSSATVKARAFKSGMADSAVASANYTITAPSVTTLSNNSPVTGLSGSAGAERTYKITVPSGQAKLEIKSYGGSGDADLFVKRGSVPTTSSYDFTGQNNGNTETITVNSPASGDWFIKVRAYSTFSSLTLLAAHYANFTVVLDAVSPAALRVGTAVTIRGTLRRNGSALPNYQFGVHNGLRQQSHLATTDSTGRFAITSTPASAQASVVEFLADGRAFASAAYQVLPSTDSPASLLVREIRYKNSTARTIKARVANPYGQTLNYTIAPNATQTLVSSNARGVTFKPTAYTGTFATAGLGAADIGGSVTVNSSGVATVQVTAGAGVLLRFSTYTTSQLDAGVCWSPGGSIGAGGGVDIGADICMGSNGLSVGGGAGVGVITSGFSIQLIEW